MKKVSIFAIITLGILTIIALEGRALQCYKQCGKKYSPEMLTLYLLSLGFEPVVQTEYQPFHQAEI